MNNKITLKFQEDLLKKEFLAWFLDWGGECEFLDYYYIKHGADCVFKQQDKGNWDNISVETIIE